MFPMVSYQTFKSTIKRCAKNKKHDKKFVDTLNYTGIKFPVDVKQYNKVGKLNNINMKINNHFQYISQTKNSLM